MIHQLKGLGGSYGFPDITEISAKIEFQLVGKNYTEATALLNELHIVIERIILGYQQTDSNVRNVAGI